MRRFALMFDLISSFFLVRRFGCLLHNVLCKEKHLLDEFSFFLSLASFFNLKQIFFSFFIAMFSYFFFVKMKGGEI